MKTKTPDHSGIELNGIANSLMIVQDYVRQGVLTKEDAEPIERNLRLFERYVLAWKDFGTAISWHDVKTNPQNFKNMQETFALTSAKVPGKVE